MEESVSVRALNTKQLDEFEVPLCRICLTKTNEVYSIFDTIDKIIKTKLSDLVMIVSPICIGPEDNLPSNICKLCKQNLLIAYEFRELSIKSDRLLKDGNEKNVAMVKSDGMSIVKTEQDSENYDSIYELKDIVEKEETNQDSINSEVMVMVEGDARMNKEAGQTLARPSRQTSFHTLENLSFDCCLCTHRFSTFEELLQHDYDNHHLNTDEKKKKNVGKQHACAMCDKVFDNADSLLRHSNDHSLEPKPFKCEMCHQQFTTKLACAHHQITHNNIVEIKCLICAKVFPKKESLSSHMKVHKGEMSSRTFQCEYCPRKFAKISLLTRHSKTHADKKIHESQVCGKTIAMAGPLIDHLNIHRGLKHVCEICNKSFQRACKLRDHLRVHSGEQPYLCSECGKAFKNGGNLRQHLMRHTEQKLFACNQCPSRFTCKAGLNSHMHSHSGLKPYVCDECGSSFTQPYSLSKHKRIHTGEKPYQCETCSMRFNSSDHLKRHKRTHTGEKPYKCKFCERAFTQSNDLVKHLRSHVGDNTYSCDKCSAAFRLHCELKAHIQSHFLEEKQKMSGGSVGESCSNSDVTVKDKTMIN